VELIFGIRFATSNSSLNLAGGSKPDMRPHRQLRDVRSTLPRLVPERSSIGPTGKHTTRVLVAVSKPSVVPDIVSVRTSGFTQGVA
jgi:hypothetical protein